MPRYFFHIANGRTFKDDLGELFLGIAEAMAHAADIAKALGDDAGWRDGKNEFDKNANEKHRPYVQMPRRRSTARVKEVIITTIITTSRPLASRSVICALFVQHKPVSGM